MTKSGPKVFVEHSLAGFAQHQINLLVHILFNVKFVLNTFNFAWLFNKKCTTYISYTRHTIDKPVISLSAITLQIIFSITIVSKTHPSEGS